MKKNLYNYTNNNQCLDCGVLIRNDSLRCGKCQAIIRSKIYKGEKFKGKNNPCWKKGRIKNYNGYILIYSSNHPNGIGKDKHYVYEHRLMIEAKLNNYSLEEWIKFCNDGNFLNNIIFLEKEKVIHHINGKRDDNRPENLMLFKNENEHKHYHKQLRLNRMRKKNVNRKDNNY